MADYDNTTYNPSFVIINEGAYSSLFEKGDLGDTKEFMEGKGKALQMKGKTLESKTWVNVPLILSV